MDDIMAHEGKEFLSKIAKEGENGSFDKEQKAIIAEREIQKTLVNGYPVSYPVDKRANEFEMVVFLSAFPLQLIESVEKTCGRHFPGINPDFNSGTGVYFHVLRDFFPEEDNFIVAHISGEMTDVSVVKNDIITETISFPLGRNFIVRRLMSEAPGVTPAVALSMIKANADSGAAPKLSEKLAKILSEAEEDWVQLFADSMRDFAEDFFLPTKVYILAGDDSAKTFSDLITKKKLTVRGAGTPVLLAGEIGSALFDSSIEGGTLENRDPFLVVETYYSLIKYFK